MIKILYAVEDTEWEIKMGPGSTCIMFSIEDATYAESTLYSLMRIVKDEDVKKMLLDAFKTVRVSHTKQEVQ